MDDTPYALTAHRKLSAEMLFWANLDPFEKTFLFRYIRQCRSQDKKFNFFREIAGEPVNRLEFRRILNMKKNQLIPLQKEDREMAHREVIPIILATAEK